MANESGAILLVQVIVFGVKELVGVFNRQKYPQPIYKLLFIACGLMSVFF